MSKFRRKTSKPNSSFSLCAVNTYHIYIYIKEQPQQAALKGTISRVGCMRRGKTGKWWVLAQPPYWRKSELNSWEVKGSAIVLFLFYVNISAMLPRFRSSSQPLTMPVPWVILRVRWSILVVSTLVTASCFLAGNRESKLKSTTFYFLLLFSVFLSFLFS